MSRWLSAFLLLLALFGFGLALQAPNTLGHDATAAPALAVSEDAPVPDESRALLQAEPDTAVDVTALFEPARHPGTLAIVAATPSRFGWTPVATPFIEGLQRPPRHAPLRA